ncbi:transcription factor jumonji jmjc domain-containing protein [Caulobacter sp. Root1455]|uniref:cupin-like domain-containing protein n=1 Tax=Caulobacter sp. Root1455 TaxID=1736465 RepID=UPI0006F7CB53|nr:cupin-like domain-containing protein [Caulobacter sp. Root1455]KQZ06091.1 transcription factor jumonji jmjc domain-containing protein [Caulobacter sp. Root1455]
MDGGGVITGETLDIDALPRVAMVDRPSSADFDAIVRAERPVVIRGLLDAWPALAAGRRGPAALNAYLKAMDAGAPAPVMEAPAATGGRFGYGADLREFAFSKRQAGLGETLDRIERLLGDPAAPFVAIQMLPLATHLPAFVRDNPMPLVASKAMPHLWIGGAVRTQTHNDRDHNLACVIAGRRRFVLFPPTQVANLYVGPLDNPPPLSLVDPEAPDLARFPRYRDAYAAAEAAWLEPGDALFVPKYWWHHVTSLDPYNAMVNAWWGDTATGLERANDVFLTALLAFKDLPPGERAYWKAMFEAYVFAGDGEATTHIPDGLKGALGPMSPSFRAALKHQLKMAFLKGGA